MSGGVQQDRSSVWAFHRGALGDSVLLWPRLRAWRRVTPNVVLVTDRSKAALAVRELGIIGVDAEQARFNVLWLEGAEFEPVMGVGRVLDYVSGERPGAFRASLSRMFEGALIETAAPPRGGLEAQAWEREHPESRVTMRLNSKGPVVLHVGAGSPVKRWPLEQWANLIARLRYPIRVLAGPVERERFSLSERALFQRLDGRYTDDTLELADVLKSARAVVATDSGPGHLAAQLGISTLALFGPTDPRQWAPIGPCVRVLAPPTPSPMDWLGPEAVADGLRDLLAASTG